MLAQLILYQLPGEGHSPPSPTCLGSGAFLCGMNPFPQEGIPNPAGRLSTSSRTKFPSQAIPLHYFFPLLGASYYIFITYKSNLLFVTHYSTEPCKAEVSSVFSDPNSAFLRSQFGEENGTPLPGASVRNSARGKGHEEGGLAYAKA